MATGTDYLGRTNKMLDEMPDYMRDYIYRYGNAGKTATMFEYCRDLYMFLEFMVNDHPYFADRSMKDITITDFTKIKPEDIDNFIGLLRNTKDKRYNDPAKISKKTPVSEASLKRKSASLSAFYTHLINNGKASINPVKNSKKITVPKKTLVYLTNEEQNTLLKAVRYGTGLGDNALKYHNKYAERDSALFLLLLDTGLRVSEMLGTNIVDYDLEKCSVNVIRKGGDEQPVYFSDECAGYLGEYFDSQRTKFYFTSDVQLPAFTTASGERLGVRAVEKLVAKYVQASLPKKAGTISPHKLRSSFAMSFYAANNYDILLLKKKLNHKSVNTTNIYADATDRDVEASRNSLQNLR